MTSRIRSIPGICLVAIDLFGKGVAIGASLGSCGAADLFICRAALGVKSWSSERVLFG